MPPYLVQTQQQAAKEQAEGRYADQSRFRQRLHVEGVRFAWFGAIFQPQFAGVGLVFAGEIAHAHAQHGVVGKHHQAGDEFAGAPAQGAFVAHVGVPAEDVGDAAQPFAVGGGHDQPQQQSRQTDQDEGGGAHAPLPQQEKGADEEDDEGAAAVGVDDGEEDEQGRARRREAVEEAGFVEEAVDGQGEDGGEDEAIEVGVAEGADKAVSQHAREDLFVAVAGKTVERLPIISRQHLVAAQRRQRRHRPQRQPQRAPPVSRLFQRGHDANQDEKILAKIGDQAHHDPLMPGNKAGSDPDAAIGQHGPLHPAETGQRTAGEQAIEQQSGENQGYQRFGDGGQPLVGEYRGHIGADGDDEDVCAQLRLPQDGRARARRQQAADEQQPQALAVVADQDQQERQHDAADEA